MFSESRARSQSIFHSLLSYFLLSKNDEWEKEGEGKELDRKRERERESEREGKNLPFKVVLLM